MELQKYLDINGLTLQQVGEACGVTPQAISNYARNKRRPEPDVAREIVRFTGGQVSWEDLYAYKPVRKAKC